MIGWLFDFAYGQDARVFDGRSTCTNLSGETVYSSLGWYFWNGKLDKHESFDLQDLRRMGLTVDEIRDLVFSMPRITYMYSR